MAALVGGDPRPRERLLAAGVRALSDGAASFTRLACRSSPGARGALYTNIATRGALAPLGDSHGERAPRLG